MLRPVGSHRPCWQVPQPRLVMVESTDSPEKDTCEISMWTSFNRLLVSSLCPPPPLLSMEMKALRLPHILSSGDLPPRPFPPSLLHLRISVPSLPFDWFPIPAAQLQSTCMSQSLAQWSCLFSYIETQLSLRDSASLLDLVQLL